MNTCTVSDHLNNRNKQHSKQTMNVMIKLGYILERNLNENKPVLEPFATNFLPIFLLTLLYLRGT